MKNKIILASGSPRRRELMSEAGFTFEVIPAVAEEIIPANTSAESAATMLAQQKAAEIASKYPDCTVIGADTIVFIDGKILGKPADRADAFAMLRRLSGRCHTVYTGVAITGGVSEVFCESTQVEFHELSDREIEAYLDTGEPFDKAGAYGIQGKGMTLVRRINGDFYNVMGLPISRVSRILNGLDDSVTARRSYGISDLLDIMRRLRVECPWDKEQTHASIRVNVIEEAYEVAEAIDLADSGLLCEELGDLLLQVVFHACMAGESGDFDFEQVCDGICKKLIYRHPHVFGSNAPSSSSLPDGESAGNAAVVLANWETLKAKSKGDETTADRLDSVPKTLPALMRGEKVGKRAANAGFDFADVRETIDGLRSELEELELAMLNKDEREIEQEFGDILLSCCNLGRFLEKDCEKALTFATNKFIMRFRRLEDMVSESGKRISDLDPKRLDELWQLSKKNPSE
jgi:tetrapyrrole methylase family protein/MazG family protein